MPLIKGFFWMRVLIYFITVKFLPFFLSGTLNRWTVFQTLQNFNNQLSYKSVLECRDHLQRMEKKSFYQFFGTGFKKCKGRLFITSIKSHQDIVYAYSLKWRVNFSRNKQSWKFHTYFIRSIAMSERVRLLYKQGKRIK